ncbi:DUF1330 domain-containing protein [Methylobacterium fujisawaense]|uniref:DUF1330 domain-containing protein n=1 Tax=Methylobacterium fujisawaense TaxID=107400 RepID=UPI0036F679B3
MRPLSLRALLNVTLVVGALTVCLGQAEAFGGGFMHGGGMGGHGMYGGPGLGGQGMHEHGGMGARGMRGGAPSLILVTVDKVADAERFRTLMTALGPALATFSGRLTVDADHPTSWEGTATQHIAMIRFDDPQRAEAWHQSDAFKTFDADLLKVATVSIQFVPGLPENGGVDRGRGHRGFDMKAFEPFVKKNDVLLGKLKGICSGC